MRAFALGLILAASAFAQDPAQMAPYQLFTFDGNSGQVTACAGCYIYTYTAGTNTPRATYTDSSLATPNTNPVRTNGQGYAITAGNAVSGIWVGSSCYKFVAKDSSMATIWTTDNLCDQAQVLKALLAGSTGASLIGFRPTNGDTTVTVAAALNSAFIYDIGFSTTAAACGSSITVAVTKQALWNNMSTMTCAAPLWFPTGAGVYITPAASQTVTVNPQFTCGDYQRCFNISASGSAVLFSSSRPANPNWFGADWTRTNDSSPAFVAAFAASDVISPLSGSYRLTALLAMPRSGTAIRCPNVDSILSYAESSDVNAVVQLPTFAGVIENCSVRGNAHVTKGLIYGGPGAGHRVTGANCLAATISTDVPASFIYFFNGNTNRIDSPTCSGQHITRGIVFEDEANDTITVPKIEAITNEGLLLKHGAGIVCSGNTIIGGTSEGNGGGLTMQTCNANTIIGLDLEVNTTYFVDDGLQNIYINTGGAFHFLTGARGPQLIGANPNAITIDSGAFHVTILGGLYGGGGFTNNGTCTSIQGMQDLTRNLPELSGCNSGTVIASGLNVAAETAGSANDALIASFAPYSGVGGSPVFNPCNNFTNLPGSNGTTIQMQLDHALTGGAATLDFCGIGALALKKASNVGTNPAAVSAGFGRVNLQFIYGSQLWAVLGQ